MVHYKHNEPYYELKLINLPEGSVKVLAFKGEEAISRLFCYKIELVSDDPELDPGDILNQKASLVMNRGDEDPIQIHGIISHFEQRGRTPNYVQYYAELVPRMWRLTLTKQSEIFQKMDIQKIVSQILEDSGFSGTDYNLSDLKESYPELEYVVQHNETNFDFVNRRLEHFGIFYYFDHSGDADVIVFADSNDTLPAIEQSEDIFYNPNRDPLSEKETISQITCQSKVVTGLVRLKDYNFRTPTRDLTVESQIDSNMPGTLYEFGSHFKDTDQGDFLARVRNQEIVAGSKVFKGKSDCRLFRAGNTFKLGQHYRDDWNEMEYLLTKVTSEGTQRSLFALLPKTKDIGPTFSNNFEAIPADVDFRPPRITKVPKIPGIMSAKVETGSSDEYAYVDDQGQYRVKAPFDLSDRGNGEASRAMRLTQPYSGPGYGIHFPNHADTEFVFSCINGDADRPIGIGTVPNPSQSSPVAIGNKNQSIIRTAAGNEIVMDDKSAEAQIGIKTPDDNKLLFDDKDDQIKLTTKDKHEATFDDKNKKIHIKTKDGHEFTMDDKNQKISVVSKNGHNIIISDGDGSELISLMDKAEKNILIIDISNDKIVIKSENGNIDMHAPNGTIDLKAHTLNVKTTGNIKYESEASYLVETTGKYTIKSGGDIEVKADGDLKMSGGMDAELKAAMNLKCEGGLNADVKAGMNLNLDAGINLKAKGGVQGEYLGGGMAKLKGANTFISGSPMVYINSGG